MNHETLKCCDVIEEDSVSVTTLGNFENTIWAEDRDFSDHSEELFSDEDEPKNENYFTPEVLQAADDCSFLNSFKTPVLHSSVQDTTPGRAVIPNTPMSLAPFISKINEPWTSELETPDSKLAKKTQSHSAERVKCLHSVEKNVSKKQLTPVLESIKTENTESLSPVFKTNKTRRRTKRRIFKQSLSENSEISQDLEKQIECEESAQNKNAVKRVLPSLDQPESETSCSDAISHLNSDNSTPECLNGQSNVYVDYLKSDILQPSTSCSVDKSLIDKVKDIKRLQKTRKKASDLNQVDISVTDFCKDVIQLEQASNKFLSPAKQVSESINQLGLVPFSRICKEMSEKPSCSKSRLEENNLEDHKGKEVLTEKAKLSGKQNIRGTVVATASFEMQSAENSKSLHKIFSNKSEKDLNKSTESVNNAPEPIKASEDEEDMFAQIDENIMDIGEFSQWLYICKDDLKNDSMENIKESENSDETKCKINHEDIKKISDFAKAFESEESNKSSKVEIIKQVPDESKEKLSKLTSYECVTVEGESIQINEDEPLKSKSIFKDLENINVAAEFSKEATSKNLEKVLYLPTTQRHEMNEINTKPITLEFKSGMSNTATTSACGFSTARGKSIKMNDEKLRKAGMLFKDVEDINSVLESVIKEKETAALETKNILEYQHGDSHKLGINSPPGFSLSSAKTILTKEGISELRKNIPCGFATASGKSITISEQKLLKAKKIYDETEANSNFIALKKQPIAKENQNLSPSSESIAGPSTNKLKTTPQTDLLNKYPCGMKRKLLKEDSRHQKKFRSSDIRSVRYSLGLNTNLPNRLDCRKSISEVPTGNRAIYYSNEEGGIQNNLIKCDLIVPEVKQVQSGFATASGKSIEICKQKLLNAKKLYENIDQCEDLVKDGNSKSVGIKRNFSLPVDTKDKQIVKRRSLQVPLSDDNFQYTRKDNLSIESSISRSDGKLIAKPLERKSSPLFGFNFNDFETSAFSVIKFQEFLETEQMKLSGRIIIADTIDDLRKQLNETEGALNKKSEEEIVPKVEKLDEEKSKHEDSKDGILEMSVSKAMSPEKKEKRESPDKFEIPVGFSSASGRKISINKDALSKANLLFSDDNLSDLKSLKLLPNTVNNNLTTKTVRVSEDALQNGVELSESFPKEVKLETSIQKSTSILLQKRRIEDVDGETPLGRQDASKCKKPKLAFDLQARKLFSEDSDTDDEVNQHSKNVSNKSEVESSTSIVSKATKSDDTIFGVTLVSEELIESVEALLKDEEDSNDAKFNIEIKEEEDGNSENARRSPIIGLTKKNMRKRRRTKTLEPVKEESENIKSERFNSDVNTDSRMSSQNLESESTVHDTEILERRFTAALEQDKIIARKRRQRPKPIEGSFSRNREEFRNSRISLYEFANRSTPTPRTFEELRNKEIDPEVFKISASNAVSYKFQMEYINRISGRNMVSLEVGDGAIIVLDESGSAGVKEFERAFEASPGIDPRLLPLGWVQNHYRWIVWKLASMDRMKMGFRDMPRMLTPDRVMKDLKYRYDREIDRSQRSAIRKILEKDDVPSKRMVLCIATITESVENEKEEKDPRILLRTPRWKVEVTDGWYSLPVSFDTAMVKHITDGKVQEGTKIVTYGAELFNCDQGCFPLEKPVDVCLKIHTNSTRRDRWDTKLGYQSRSGPIPTKLKAIDPNGGFIGKVTVVVSRIYPIMYREKIADGQSINRNARNEEKARMAYEELCQSKVEAIYAEAEKKLEGKKNDSSEEDSSESLLNYDSVSHLTESQKQKLLSSRQAKEEKLKQKLESKLKADLPPPRQVFSFQKVRIVEGDICAILTVWSKTDEVEFLKEGDCFSIFNINAYGRRDGDLHLTSNRQTMFKAETTLKQPYLSRIFTPLRDIATPGFDPPYCELDTVGVVSWIGTSPHGMKNFEAICLTYPNEDSSSSYLTILFWQGVSSYGFSKILTVGSLVACINLECRKTRNAAWSIPMCYCSDRTAFTCNPRQTHLLSAFEALKKQVDDPMSFAFKSGKEISSLIQKRPASRVGLPGSSNSTPLSVDQSSVFNSPNFALAKNSLDTDTPAKSVAIQKRLERLASYGQPPDLSPIIFKTPNSVKSDFRPVIRTPDSAKLTKTVVSDST